MDRKFKKYWNSKEKNGLGNNKTLIYTTIADLAKENIHDEQKFLRYMKEVVKNLGIFKIF